MNKLWLVSIASLITLVVGMGTYHKITVNRIKKEHDAEIERTEQRYIGLISRIEERNKEVIEIYKDRETNLLELNNEQQKIMDDLGRIEVIKQRPKLVEPKLNKSFRGIIDEIAKETNRSNSD